MPKPSLTLGAKPGQVDGCNDHAFTWTSFSLCKNATIVVNNHA